MKSKKTRHVVDLEKHMTPGAHVIMGRDRAQDIIAAEKLNEFKIEKEQIVFQVPEKLFVIMPTCFQELMSFLPATLTKEEFDAACRFEAERYRENWQNTAFERYHEQNRPAFLP